MHSGFHSEAFSPCSIGIHPVCAHSQLGKLHSKQVGPAAQGTCHGQPGGWVMSDPAGTARVAFSEASAFLRLSELHRNLLEVNLNGI